MSPAQRHQRRDLIAGLRTLAAFLDSHSQVPVPRYGTVRVSVHTLYDTDATTEAEALAEVGRVAALLGVAPTIQRGHHVACATFGAVCYEALHVTHAAMARVQALDSYRDAITLDEIKGV